MNKTTTKRAYWILNSYENYAKTHGMHFYYENQPQVAGVLVEFEKQRYRISYIIPYIELENAPVDYIAQPIRKLIYELEERVN